MIITTAYGGRMQARFAPVRDCFHDLFATGRETGAALAELIDGGFVRPIVGARFPMDQAAEALKLIDGRGATGKVVLETA